MSAKAHFPPADFVRRGPPVGVRDVERKKREKWSRVVVVMPRPQETAERIRYDFAQRGPFTLPLAIMRSDAVAGSQDVWNFFTHPYAVFPQDACFYNAEGKGCLGARLFVRAPEGVRLYDEVGANLKGSEFVSDSYPGALGVLRHRVLGGDVDSTLRSPYHVDLLELDVDLLELFYVSTLLLKTKQIDKALARIFQLLSRTTVRNFVQDVFSEELHALIKSSRAGKAAESDYEDLRVREADMIQAADVKDVEGTQVVAEMILEFAAFEAEHKDALEGISEQINGHLKALSVIKGKVRALREAQKDDKAKRGISGVFKRVKLFGKSKTEQINELKAEAVKELRAKRALEASLKEIPGYERLRGITDRVQGFTDGARTVQDMARNIVDHNVTRSQINSMRALIRENVAPGDDEEARKALRTYALRLRAEILPRLLASYEISAYVLRRPDAIRRDSSSFLNVQRINRLAHCLIDYFRYMRYGNSNLGEAFDSGWGQVLQLEAQL